MKKLRILWGILKRTRADHILLGFILFLLADAAVIRLVEPDIHRYGDALWYCYAVISTAGFGDIVTVTLIGKICSGSRSGRGADRGSKGSPVVSSVMRFNLNIRKPSRIRHQPHTYQVDQWNTW